MEGLAWLIGFTLPFMLVQYWLHREIQYLFMLITHRLDLAVGLFSLLFFPGILLHELSHLVAAWICRVRINHFSLIPHTYPNGKVRLGYVETGQAGLFRDALIGTAPLISGGIAIAVISYYVLGLPAFFTGEVNTWWNAIQAIPSIPDFWIWFYLIFAISSTMLPSASDRKAWLPVVIGLVLLILLISLAGLDEWLISHIKPALQLFISSFSAVMGVSLLAHIILLIPLAFLRLLLCRLFKVEFR
jgi:hypothetical protein